MAILESDFKQQRPETSHELAKAGIAKVSG